jgi:hypothetical protein
VSNSYVYVVAFVVRENFPVAQIGPEDVCFWSTTLQDCNEHEAYDQGYRAFRAASPDDLGIPATLKTTILNDYVVALSSPEVK